MTRDEIRATARTFVDTEKLKLGIDAEEEALDAIMDAVRRYERRLSGQQGGKMRSMNLTREQKVAIARKAAETRWRNPR